MNDIIITRVRNGWVVRRFEPNYCGAVTSQDDCSVYNDIEELQQALPFLLKVAPPASPLVTIPHSEFE